MNVDSVETLKLVPTSIDVAFSINQALSDKLPHFLDLAPFRASYEISVGRIGSLYICRITDTGGRSQTNARAFSPDETAFLKSLEASLTAAPSEAYQLLGPSWIAWNKFSYVGPFEHCRELAKHMEPQLLRWVNIVLIPSLVEINKRRGQLFAPKVMSLDKRKIMSSLWVLESEQALSQGTAFYLEGAGMVTAPHTLFSDTVAFQPPSISQFPVKVVRQHGVIDLAIIEIDREPPASLSQSTSDTVDVLDPVAIAGFPNYRRGDSGTLVTGTVAGFRMNSGIRRVLVDAAIIAGNSGGPVLDRNGEVIGVAVTGADAPENINITEDHSFVPIGALALF